MRPRILFVSNGFSEDLIAARIAEALPADVEIAAYPLVGLGAYPAGMPLLEPRREMPSAGFSLRTGFRRLGADLAAGLLSLWRAQRRTLAGQRGRWTLGVAVGDVYCLWMAGLIGGPVVFVSTADSVRTGGFSRPARWAMRRYAHRIFTRDRETAAALARLGLPAAFVGNVMMDQVRTGAATFDLPDGAPVVTLLPGSRRDAPENAVRLLCAAAALAARLPQTHFLLALAPTVAADAVRAAAAAAAAAGRLPLRVAADGDLLVAGAPVRLTPAFGDAVVRAWIVLGMAGTAHEQAAGLGRPVVAFPGTGVQFGPAFLAMQRRLLGDALVPARGPEDAAEVAARLLGDDRERRRRGEAGRAVMGPPGGAARIAAALIEGLTP